jgi:hypothetical protein
MNLQIGIPCGLNSEKYTEHLINNIDITISKSIDYEFVLGVTNSRVDLNYLKKIKSKKKIKILKNFFFNNLFRSGSTGHGITLNLIYKNMTADYGLIIDSDVAFLDFDWDETFLKLLNKRIIIAGSEYDGNKYKNFPNAICCFFDLKKLKKIKIDWRPVTFFNKLQMHRVKQHEEVFFGVNNNSKIFKDTGYKVFYNIKKNGYDGISFKLFRKNYKNKKFIETEGEEYQIYNKPIFTHLGRSLTRNFETDANAIRWRKSIENWINKNE